MARALVAGALLLAACNGGPSKLDDMPAGSASGSGSAACVDSDLSAHVHETMEESKRYFTSLKTHAASWTTDCDAVRKDLESLEPDADRFQTEMTHMMEWAKSLPPPCRSRLAVLGDKDPLNAELEKQAPALEKHMAVILDRCKDHPGFADAQRKGLRLLKKKR